MKPLAAAKSRLSRVLADADRQALSFAMFHDVLDCLLRAPAIDAVFVVTADRRLLDLAARRRAIGVDEKSPRGLNGAVALGTARALAEGAASALVVLSDLPFVTTDEIDAIYANLPAGRHVRLVRSHEGLGTNALLRQPADVISTRFGGRSFQDHLAAAADAEVPSSVADLPGLSFDVDTFEDLERFAAAPLAVGSSKSRPTRTYAEARKIGLATTRPI
jgi:2-phospho-L-lactate guanylyltransferase